MFTVIIAEKKHFDAIEQNRLFFKPFLDKSPEEFAFCEWKPEGQTLYESVPDLVRTVGRHKLWRAVIVNENSRTSSQNPFDQIGYERIAQLETAYSLFDVADGDPSEEETADYSDLETAHAFADWKKECADKLQELLGGKTIIYREALQYPLQRLATCLCYVPSDYLEQKSKQKQDASDFVYEQINEYSTEKTLAEFERCYYLKEDEVKNSLRKECIELMLPEDLGLRRKGSMGIVLPSEVYCIAERTTENGFFNPVSYWENHTGFEYSSFVGRNMYFDKMRFIVFDLLPENHQDYRYDRIRFLYNLLLFSLNEVPTGAILPRKLYCLESDNDEKPLRELISSYCCKLENTIAVVDGQIEKIRNEIPGELTDKEAQSLFCANVNIPVSFSEEFNSDELLAQKKKIGLSTDCPEDEYTSWQKSYATSKEALEKLVKQPRRALKKAVDRIEPESEVDYNKIRVLNTFQMDDVREYTEEAEDTMVNTEVSDIFDITRFYDQLEEENQKVNREIARRMRKKTTIALVTVCLGLLLIGFLPLLINNHADVKTVVTAVVFIGVALGLLLLALIVVLICMRKPLKKAIRSYNNTARDILNEVTGAIRQFSKYLSCVCNVRRGHRVLSFSDGKLDIYDRSIRTRNKHKTDMEKCRAFTMDHYGDFVDAASITDDDLMTKPYEYDFGKDNREYEYVPPYLRENQKTIEYLERGNTVAVPSAFVTRVTIRMEEIYDQ